MAANTNGMTFELKEQIEHDLVEYVFQDKISKEYCLDLPFYYTDIPDCFLESLKVLLNTKSDCRVLRINGIPPNEESFQKIADFFRKNQDLNIDKLLVCKNPNRIEIKYAVILYDALKNHKSIVRFKSSFYFIEFGALYYNWQEILNTMAFNRYDELPLDWDLERVKTVIKNANELMQMYTDFISNNQTLKEFEIELNAPIHTDKYLVMLANSLGMNSVLENLTVSIGDFNWNFYNCEFNPETFFNVLREANCNLKVLNLNCRKIITEMRGVQSIISFFETANIETFLLSGYRTDTDTLSFKGGTDEAYDYLLSEIIEKSKSLKSLTFDRPIIPENRNMPHHIEKVDRIVAALKRNKTLEIFSLGENTVRVGFYEFLKENTTLQKIRAMVKYLDTSYQTCKELTELIYLNTSIKSAEYEVEVSSLNQNLSLIRGALARNVCEAQAVSEFHKDIRHALSPITTLNPEHAVLRIVTSYLEDDKPFDEIFPRVTFLYEKSKTSYNEVVYQEKIDLGKRLMLARKKQEKEKADRLKPKVVSV